MSYIAKLKNFLFDSDRRFLYLNALGFWNYMPDEKYIKKLYKVLLKKDLNLENPQTFNEKLQWLKLHDRNPEYSKMVDKYEVKKYVADKIGEQHIIENFGIWDRFDDIDFDSLPNQFVLKCTHDSGGLVICRDKSKLDRKKARKNINKSLKRSFYYEGREWPYKNVKPRIIAEQYMSDGKEDGLTDYKFYCFNGEPRFLYVSQGLENHATAQISFLTLDWQFAPYTRSDFRPFSKLPQKPQSFDEMIKIAKGLSAGHDFMRVDMYQIGNQVYFSELTFFPCAGFMPFGNPEHDAEMGKMIKLTKKN